ncbi:MAG: hypothetical protein HOV76_02125 [Hamadaea sp.]|nr:hypothetical protein [Hamadaea sp.]
MRAELVDDHVPHQPDTVEPGAMVDCLRDLWAPEQPEFDVAVRIRLALSEGTVRQRGNEAFVGVAEFRTRAIRCSCMSTG